MAYCRALTEEIHEKWKMFLDHLPPERFQETVSYKTTAGESFETAIGDILSHVIIHGGYHRGQIATLLRLQDEAAAVTDFIAYVRVD